MKKSTILTGVLSGLLLLGIVGNARSTVLTFNDFGVGYYGDIPDTYGDRVTALSDAVGSYGVGNGFTPNVEVAYATVQISDGTVAAPSLGFWPDSYGNLTNVAFPIHWTGHYGEVALIPDAGYAVRLNSFDLGGWPYMSYASQPLRILDGSGNLLMDLGPTVVLGAHGTHSHFAPDLTFVGTTRVQFGNHWNIGIDNINFDQVSERAYYGLPVPSTLLLLSASLAGLGWIRRR
jgi:hypothetical protein